MNNKKSIIMSVALAASMLATSMSAFAYTDISADHWASSYINNLSGKKYVSGYEDGTYKPDNYVTRAEFAKILTNIFGVIDKNGVTLVDVADSAWYADTMKIAVKAGFITGYSDGTVKPEANITRQEAAVMVYRAWALSPEGSLYFSDAAEIADWAANQVATLAAKKVINGYEDGTFKPNNYITRAEVAKIISTALELGINKTTASQLPTGTTSGILHIGVSSGNNSGNVNNNNNFGGPGGGGSLGGNGGGSLGGNTGGTTVTPQTPPTVSAGAAQEVEADTNASTVVDALDNSTLADTDTVVLTLNVAPELEDVVKVTSATTGEMTVAEFNAAMAAGMSKADVKAILESLKVIFTDVATAITATVENETGDAVAENVEITASVNFVVEALKDYQEGTADTNDLAVIACNLVDGYESSAAGANWLNLNARQHLLYNDILTELGAAFANVEVTADNYSEFVTYFNAMISIIDNAATYAANQNGTLTKDTALSYFETSVVASIDAAVKNAEDAKVIKTIAKAFGAKYATKIDAVNTAVAGGSDTTTKVALVFDVFNNNRK